MSEMILKPAQLDTQSFGQLQINLTAELTYTPIENARVQISYPGQPDRILDAVTTDASGRTPLIELPTPPKDYSLDPEASQPYSDYSLAVTASGYEKMVINGTQMLSGETAIQPIQLLPQTIIPENDIVIPAHTLYAEYPPKIPESEVKPVADTGEIVLSRVVVPETIVVHNGPPNDASATNYYVPFADYIKNVASSEIYATWPQNTIIANVLAILSFTLNRVYTEWYRSKGYDFTITSSTAYDHAFVPGRNYFESISEVVDTIFTNYLSRPLVRQPILTQYCDGRRVSCPNWMRQWESKDLGEQGLEPIEIIRFFYGEDMYINAAEQISGIPSSWPGAPLDIGSSGPKVLQLQEQLNRIARNYPAIPTIVEDGIYGPATAEAVRTFQRIFDLPQTGITDYRTWYKISAIYVGVSRIAELN